MMWNAVTAAVGINGKPSPRMARTIPEQKWIWDMERAKQIQKEKGQIEPNSFKNTPPPPLN